MRGNVFIGLLALVIVICFCTNSSTAGNSDPKSAAQSSRDLLKQRAGSEENLRKNLINPLLGGGILKTLDQSKSGQVQVACPGSKEFLTVLIQPKSTGDFDASIYWDSNFDEKLDKSLFISDISGVCTNGFIKCTPGTWHNCKEYVFLFENGNLTVQDSYRTELAGCFCVNNSCGNNLVWTNLGYILKTFGGAIAGAFQKAEPRYAISDSSIDGTAIYFYGQKAKDCTIVSGGSGALYPETYYKSPSLIPSAVENLVMTQSQDSNSYYNMLVTFSSNTPSQLRSCIIKRNVYSRLDSKYKPCRDLIGDNFRFVGGWDADGESKQCYYARGGSCYLLSGHDSDWGTCYSRIVNHGNLLNFINASFLVGTGFTAVQVNSLSTSGMGNYVACFGSGNDAVDIWVTVDATCRYMGCRVDESIEDTCSELENNNSCVLYDEYVDNVQTLRNRVSTGLHPLKKCLTLCAESVCDECGQIRCYDWIAISRTYLCTDQPIDLSKAKQRLATVVPTTQYNESQGKITFSDIRYENNRWVSYPNQEFWVGTEAKPDMCEQACRVRVRRDNTQVSIGDPVKGMHSAQMVPYVYYYRTCEKGVCPVEPGDEIDIPCRCMNDFGAASTILQTLRLAGQDIICTTGNIKTIPGY